MRYRKVPPRRATRYHPSGWLRGVVLGLDDGLVTTLVTVVALSSAATAHLLIVMVNVVLASACSMGLGGYASARLSNDAYPMLQGLETGGAFLLGGLAPLVPLVFNWPYRQLLAYLCTALVALAFGAFKAKYTDEAQGAIQSAAFFLAIVTIGTLAGLVIGWMVS